ncbi:cyclase [Candidatus Dependentiae bacterium Noda2021]|nr:cyclase [Candidatus Dependentiae bacterium Noda2021]
MHIIDISWPVGPAITAYKDKKTVEFYPLKNFDADHVRESKITLGAHTGTHVDAPSHFVKDGLTIDKIDLQTIIGQCVVIDCTEIDNAIDADFLKKQAALKSGQIILLKTKNSALAHGAPFNPDFIFLNHSAAEYCAEQKVKAIGIDYLGIERGQPDHATHTALFNTGITIIEGLRLEHVTPGSYFLCCLPLALQGIEAAPARAVLLPSINL